MDRPVIGITARNPLGSAGGREVGIPKDYVNAVARAGGIPALLPPIAPEVETAAVWIDRVDGIVFSGGGDMDPALYRRQAHPKTGETDSGRDHFEIALRRAAWERGMPVLGICRGIQLINVAFGGALIQDIPEETGSTIEHYVRTASDAMAHPIRCTPGSLVAECLGATEIETNSRHHQAVDVLAPGLEVTARAPDGIIEAVESNDARPLLGVQFHPENLVKKYPAFLGLFTWLVDRAR